MFPDARWAQNKLARPPLSTMLLKRSLRKSISHASPHFCSRTGTFAPVYICTQTCGALVMKITALFRPTPRQFPPCHHRVKHHLIRSIYLASIEVPASGTRKRSLLKVTCKSSVFKLCVSDVQMPSDRLGAQRLWHSLKAFPRFQYGKDLKSPPAPIGSLR